MRFTTCFALTGGLICAGTIMAAAWPATTTGNVNVRSGPGARYSVVNSLPAGVPVDVLSCSGAWCQTQYGYVSSRLISQSAAAPGMAPAMPGYAGNAGTNYRQNYAPAAAGVPPAMAPAGAPYAGGRAIAPIDSASGGQDETMSGARTTIGSANVRSGPGIEYDIVKTLPDFTKVEVQGCAHAWCQTDEGYISLYLLSRGPVQQVLSPAAQPRIPGSATRDSSNYSANIAGQAAMGYGAAGTGQPYAPQAYGVGAPNYAPRAAAQPMARPYAPAVAQPGMAQPGMAQPGVARPGTGYAAGYAPGVQASAAGTATTTAKVNVRGGPGVAYGVIASLPAGAPVNVVSCTGSWCQTQYGFVSARHIAQGGMATAYAPRAAAPAYAPRAAAPGYAPAMHGYAAPIPGQPPVGAPSIVSSAYGTQPRVNPANAAPGQHTENMSGARTTIGAANVRSGPGVEYSLVKTLPDFTKVEVQGCADTWCQTDEGYISLYLLSRGPVQQVLSPAAQPRIAGSATRDSSNYYANAAGQAAMGYGAAGTAQPPQTYGAPSPGTAYRQNYAPAAGQMAYGAAAGTAVTTATANVRSGPGVRFGLLGSLPAGTPVNVVSCAGAWCQTQYGFISARLVSRGLGAAVQQVQQHATPALPPVQNYARRAAPAAPARRYAAPVQDDYGALPSAGYGGAATGYGQVTGGNYSNATYIDPAYAGAGYGNAGNPVYNSRGFVPGQYPADNLLLDIAAPVAGIAGAGVQPFAGYDNGGPGVGNWTASLGPRYFGPGYWGPGLRGRRAASYWGARPSYWGGRASYWNIHPGYPTRSNFGDRNGDMYWSRANEGRRPQSAAFYSMSGGVGPYGMALTNRPVIWRPRAGIY